MVNKIFYFFLLFLALIGFVGGIGYSVYCGAIPVGICVGVLGYFAYPKIKKYFNYLLNNNNE